MNLICTLRDFLSNNSNQLYDANHDGVVNQLDVTKVQRHFGSYDPICDVDGSGTVDISDLILIVNNYS